jgi:hypothetical protein
LDERTETGKAEPAILPRARDLEVSPCLRQAGDHSRLGALRGRIKLVGRKRGLCRGRDWPEEKAKGYFAHGSHEKTWDGQECDAPISGGAITHSQTHYGPAEVTEQAGKNPSSRSGKLLIQFNVARDLKLEINKGVEVAAGKECQNDKSSGSKRSSQGVVRRREWIFLVACFQQQVHNEQRDGEKAEHQESRGVLTPPSEIR